MSVPSNLKYTKDHEWVSIEGDIATVGITHFAQKELGDIVYVEVETLDQTLDKDEVFGTVEAVKTVSDLFLPLSGEIIAFNDDFGMWTIVFKHPLLHWFYKFSELFNFVKPVISQHWYFLCITHFLSPSFL